MSTTWSLVNIVQDKNKKLIITTDDYDNADDTDDDSDDVQQ